MGDLTPRGEIIEGYKATDENMCCRGFQFELGKWYKHDGDISICKSGFHFCEFPSGPWLYYNTGRLFKIEAEYVLKSFGPGADIKHVCKKIRLISEIKVGGDGNTGDGNTGDRNTGYMNTGDRNTGDRNTGDGNTGYRNTGYMNTGAGNTGYMNTGYMNTGDRNTGDGNTGYGNQGDCHSGCLNYGVSKFYIFNKIANREKVDFYKVRELGRLLQKDDDIDPQPFLDLPNATPRKIKALHEAHKKARKAHDKSQ